MSIIHFSTAFKALDTFVAQYNATYDNLSSRLRQPVIATARELIRIYGASLLKVSKSSSSDTSNIPSLKTNNIQLATIAHISTRTIQRHLNKLLQANVITQKIWHGSNASYEHETLSYNLIDNKYFMFYSILKIFQFTSKTIHQNSTPHSVN